MNAEEEKAYWKRLVNELQEVMTIADIAKEICVEDREVWRWKSGERRPMGIKAVKVYLLHVKRDRSSSAASSSADCAPDAED